MRLFAISPQPQLVHAIVSAARSHVGRVRTVNEDRMLDQPTRGLWAVADGMGGHVGGGAAATEAIRALHALDGPIDIAAISTALRDAHDAVQTAGDGRGTTIAGLSIDTDRFTAFWIGDSRIYRLRDGVLTRISHDHSLVQDLVDAGALTADQAERHPHANIITRAIGIDDWTAPDTIEGDVAAGDRFLICSDGLSGLVHESVIAIELADDPARAVDILIAAALAEGGTDNVTAIVIAVD